MAAPAHPASDGHGANFQPNSSELHQGKAPTQQYFLDEYAKEDWVAPWDIGAAQPSLIKAEGEGLFKGEILDVGCGTGDNAIYLASKGYKVTALDFSQHALDRAAKRSKAAGIADGLVLKQADVLDLGTTLGGRQWDTALDSALLHCFPPETQPQYLRQLHRHLKSGGRLLLYCMSDANKDPYVGPERLSKAHLEALYSESNGWKIEHLNPDKYQTPVREEGLHTWRGVIRRL